MQIERDGNGDFILDPAEIARRFGQSVADFRRQQEQGLVKSTVEKGEGEDAGTSRLSLRIGNRIVVPKEKFCRWVDRQTGGAR